MSSNITAWEAAARAFEPTPPPRWETPGRLAQELDPRTKQTPALELIDQALTRAHATPDSRLIISMPPQEGKSQRASRWFPLWALTQNQDLRIAIASYEAGVARRWGRAIRDDITTHTGTLGLRIRDDLAAQHEWQLAGTEGGVYTVGVGGALTGRPVDCVSADTMIDCEHGRLTAAEAFRLGITRILAYDHRTGRAAWRDVEAARRIPGRPVVDITTTSGRFLTCTPDHRVYTGRGYVPARDIRVGDALVALVAADRVPVREPLDGPEDGCPKGRAARTGPLLLAGVYGRRPVRAEPDELLRLWKPSPAHPQSHLLGPVPASQTGALDETVPALRGGVQTAILTGRVLFAGLCERGTLAADDRQGQLALQDRDQLRQLVPLDATLGPRQGQLPVQGLPVQPDVHLPLEGPDSHAFGVGDSPHRRGRYEQPSTEPHHPVLDLSCRASQVEPDTVAMVRPRSGETVDVYDFQVEGTRNFFGGGVLVHNCMIIDDPIKDRVQADSETYRERVWEWWTDTVAARLAPGAPVILILTRWHHDDLAARLLASDTGWEYLNIPAQADHTEGETDPLDRDPGEYMESARGRTTAQWEARKTAAGPRTWSALYQGHPTPDTGGVFPATWARDPHPIWVETQDGTRHVPGADEMIQSWDLAFKGTDTSDYVAWGVWARIGVTAHLVEVGHARLGFTATIEKIREITARWPQAVGKLIEDKANGPAVINALSSTIPGIIPVEPEGSKYSRAVAISPFAHSGNIVLPDSLHTPTVTMLTEEAAAFPHGKNDDLVDMMTQAINQLLLHPILTSDGDLVTADTLFAGMTGPHAYLGGY